MNKYPETLADLVKREGFKKEKFSGADRVKIVPDDLVTTPGDPKLYRFCEYDYRDGGFLKMIDKDGYRLGTLGDLLMYAKKNPKEQCHYNIFSLGSTLSVDTTHPEDNKWEFPYLGVDCLDEKIRILSSKSIFPNMISGHCNLSSKDRILTVPKEHGSPTQLSDDSDIFEIDFSKQPSIPEGWIILPESKQIGSRIQSKIEISSSMIGLHRDKSQMYRNKMSGLELRAKLESTPVLGAQLLDFLIDNRKFIPNILRDKHAQYFFWGTIYLNNNYMPCVRCLNYGAIDTGEGVDRKIEWCAPKSGYIVLRDRWEPHPSYYLDFDDPVVILKSCRV